MKIPMNYTKHRYSPDTSEQVVEDVIGTQLRSFYSTIENQEIPAQFLKLLERLDTKSSPAKE